MKKNLKELRRTLLNTFLDGSQQIGFTVVHPFCFETKVGGREIFPLLLPDYGKRDGKGMIVDVLEASSIRAKRIKAELESAGYSCSFVNADWLANAGLEGVRECLGDWGFHLN